MEPLNNYHAVVCRWLTEAGISYMEEYPVGRWSLDIYLREANLGIEVDGPQHNRKKDAERDQQIFEEFDISIIRIKVGTTKALCMEKILGQFSDSR